MWDNCLSVNDLVKVCAQLRIPPKSLFTNGSKLETSSERPRHLTKHTASALSYFVVASMTKRRKALKGFHQFNVILKFEVPGEAFVAEVVKLKVGL